MSSAPQVQILPPNPPQLATLEPPKWRTFRTVTALVLREMGSSYGRSPGGYLWALIQPLGTILVLTLAFGLVMRAPSLGTSFIMFYATGYLPFDLYTQLANKIGNALRYSRPLLAYPGVTWLDAILARLVLNFMTLVTVFCVVINGVMLFVDTGVQVRMLPIVVGTMMAAVLGTGVGMMNCLLIGYFPIWERLWEIISRPLFLASGIFFLYDDMPPIAREILWWNPLVHVTGEVRTGFYPTYHGSYVSLTYGFGVGMILILFSLIFLRRGYRAVIRK
jgi:capsular polysaccharide transport system permease protein